MELLRAPAPHSGALRDCVRDIARHVAAPSARAVDAEARFPAETVAALRQAGLLGALVPPGLGGLGASISEVAGAIRSLAAHCASSALVLAMHSIEVDTLVRHGTTAELTAFTADVAARQLLIANANSEVGLGGTAGRSLCALQRTDGHLMLEKDVLAISYGEHADALVATCRRSPRAAQSDQVLVLCRAEDVMLTRRSEWNAHGLRGTCSHGFHLRARIAPGHVFPEPFAAIAVGGGVHVRQILISAPWLGIAEAAASTAHAYVQRTRRARPDGVPAGVRLAELSVAISEARSAFESCVSWYEAAKNDEAALDDPAFFVALRNLKVLTSRLAVETATAALVICGIEGYRRDSETSLDRVLRDAHGGLVMVSNDRHLEDNAAVLRAARAL